MNNATNKAGNVKLWDLSADQRKVLESACDKAGAAKKRRRRKKPAAAPSDAGQA